MAAGGGATALEALATVAAAAAHEEAGGIAHGADAGHASLSSHGASAPMAGDGGHTALRQYPRVWEQARCWPSQWKDDLPCDVEKDPDLCRLFDAFNTIFLACGTRKTVQGAASTARQ